MALAAVHLSLVGFVVVAGQVQDAVQDEHAQFRADGAAQGTGVAACRGGRNGDIAAASAGGKREDVCGAGFSAIGAVEARDF